MKNIVTFVSLALAAASALAQPYPAKPIKFVVPFSAGSATDIVARTVAESMGKSMGQTIVVENKAGAGGTIAAAQVARSEPDGYTKLVHSSGHALNPAKGWKTQAELIAAVKTKPNQFNYASAGVGSGTHLNAEIFRLQSGIDALHVPYKGTPEAITNVIGGSNDWFFAPLAAALPLIKDGKLQALSVSTDIKERMAKLGADPFTLSPEAFNAYIKSEMDVAARIVKAANLTAQ